MSSFYFLCKSLIFHTLVVGEQSIQGTGVLSRALSGCLRELYSQRQAMTSSRISPKGSMDLYGRYLCLEELTVCMTLVSIDMYHSGIWPL